MQERLGSLDVFPPAAKYAYLDAASIALMHKGAAEAINAWQSALADDGTVAFDEEDEVRILDGLRTSAARLLNATATDIAVGPSETVMMASLAWAVSPPAGSTIVATRITHPSTVYPWCRVAEATGARLHWVPARDQYVDPEALEAAIGPETAVVCLSHVEYGSGQVHDLKRITERAHRHGAIVVVDATQSAGQVPIDVQDSGVDAVAASSYKWLCGPFGAGFIYLAPSLQGLNPGILGWRSHRDMWDFQADRLDLPEGAIRYEFGTMGYGSALGAKLAIDHLLDIGIDRIAAHNQRLAGRLVDGLRARGATILSPQDEAERSATVAARFATADAVRLARGLKDEGVVMSRRQDFLRFSPHLYNSAADIDRALAALDGLLRGAA